MIHDLKIRRKELKRIIKRIYRIPFLVFAVAVLVDPVFGVETGGLRWDIVVDETVLLGAEIGVDEGGC